MNNHFAPFLGWNKRRGWKAHQFFPLQTLAGEKFNTPELLCNVGIALDSDFVQEGPTVLHWDHDWSSLIFFLKSRDPYSLP